MAASSRRLRSHYPPPDPVGVVGRLLVSNINRIPKTTRNVAHVKDEEEARHSGGLKASNIGSGADNGLMSNG